MNTDPNTTDVIYEPISPGTTATAYRGKNPAVRLPVIREHVTLPQAETQVIAVGVPSPQGFHFTGTQLVIGAIVLYLLLKG